MNVFVYTTVLVLILFYVGRKPLDKNFTIETEKTKIRDTNTLFFMNIVISVCNRTKI